MIGEYDNNGNVISEYVYFGLRPVAVKTDVNINIVHTDYLGSPRVITSGTNGGSVMWEWKNDNPYGNNKASGSIEFNLRFAGQYYDSESGLHYNIHRTYNPEIGRYMQSDPIGLAGGSNTYNYVNRNPLSAVDPLGLSERDIQSINNVFYGTVNEMIAKDMRLPGKGSDWFNNNNAIAYKCNINNGSKTIIPDPSCTEKDKKKEICYGQAHYLKNKLETLAKNKNFDDNWNFYEQNSSTHNWVVAVSKQTIIYLDPWDVNISQNVPCQSCNTSLMSKIIDNLPLSIKPQHNKGLDPTNEWIEYQKGNIK